MNYSKGQLETLWISVGGRISSAHIAAAIALAESSGNPNATNLNANGTTDRGLWQINSVHGSQSTYNPAANARAAVSISSNGSNWTPWTTYNTGAYQQFMGGGEQHGAQLPGGRENVVNLGETLNPFSLEPYENLGKNLGEAGKGLSILGNIPGDIHKIYELLFTPAGWIRIGKVLVGTFLLLAGVLGMANVSAPSPVDVIEGGKGAKRLATAAAAAV